MRDRLLRRLIVDSGVIIALSVGAALSLNAIRKNPISIANHYFLQSECGTVRDAHEITAEEALSLVGDSETVYLDIRPRSDFLSSHIRGAINLPFSLLEPYTEDDLAGLRGRKRIIVYDLDGKDRKAFMAASELIEAGITGVFALDGGILNWYRKDGPMDGTDLSASLQSSYPSKERTN